jgi:hypothetical protein
MDLRSPRDGVAEGLERGFAAYLREPVIVRLGPGGMRSAPKPPPHKRSQFTCRWNGVW